jgi:hypothetical protein
LERGLLGEWIAPAWQGAFTDQSGEFTGRRLMRSVSARPLPSPPPQLQVVEVSIIQGTPNAEDLSGIANCLSGPKKLDMSPDLRRAGQTRPQGVRSVMS